MHGDHIFVVYAMEYVLNTEILSNLLHSVECSVDLLSFALEYHVYLLDGGGSKCNSGLFSQIHKCNECIHTTVRKKNFCLESKHR